MIVLGSTLIEDKFTKPMDAFINALMVLITLLSVRDPNTFIAWRINIIYTLAIILFSLLSIIIGSENETRNALRNKVGKFFYYIATFFGKANLIFSITFVLAVFSFLQAQSREFIVLMCFWAFLLIAQPAGLLNLIQNILHIISKEKIVEGGKLISVTYPGIMRYEQFKDIQTQSGDFVAYRQSTYNIAVITDSYSLNNQHITQCVILLSLPESSWTGKSLASNRMFYIGSIKNLAELIGDDVIIEKLRKFVGIVIENSNVNEIVFKVTSKIKLEEGYILETSFDDRQVLFQIVNAKIDTESLMTDLKTGIIKGIAQQVGMWNAQRIQFDKYGWVPPVHTPLFLLDKDYKVDYTIKSNEMVLGFIPNTNFPVIANVESLVTHHTAILGITGCGKTEMAFTIISKMIDLKTKIFCVDFTGDYIKEFESLKPKQLSISSEKARTLNEKLFAVETGQFGAGNELKELEKYKKELIPDIEKTVKDYIESSDYLGIFELSEIANTSATIAITEFYLSQIFAYARQNRDKKQKFCIVLEEAHTVIPESQTMGVQDKYSRATISKICQIALQGRKYNVGLLVIAQRTANVTKTVLNQCNSIIVFNSYDKTGFDFLENYVGPGMISAIPNLKWLHSMVVGRGFKAGRPIIMEIPFKEKFVEKPT